MAGSIILTPVGEGLFRVQPGVPVSARYPFGTHVTPGYYPVLRILALNLRAKDFKLATGFASGLWNNLRRFADIDSYRAYLSSR